MTITGTELAPATPQAEPQSANAGDAPGAAPSGQAEPEGSNDADAISRAAPVQLSWWWLGTALLAGTLGLVAWGLVRLRGGRRDNSAGTVPQRTQRRAALHRLRQACNRNDPGAMRHSLQELAAVHYGCPASSVAERLRQDPQCADVLDRLNRSLYGAGKVTVSGAEVLAAARALDHPHRSNRSNDLPELFAR